MRGGPHLRAPGPPDRHRRATPRWRRRSARATSDDRTTAAPVSASLLRFLTCGSVDDGKSTLIGRLLYDSQLIIEDSSRRSTKDSRKHGTTGEEIDLALLVDGLEAERQQGITIDVAYRFFATPRRSFIVADTPGHEQYTRNMATGASNSDLAIILIDARKGVLTQTRRHSYICSLLGIRHVVVAVNKIDLVDFDAGRLRPHRRRLRDLRRAARLPFRSCRSRSPHASATTSRRGRATCPGTAAPRCSSIWRRSRSRHELAEQALPLPRAVGEPAESRFPRLLRHRRLGPGRRSATRSWWRPRARARASPASSRPMATWRRPAPARR